MQMRRNWLFGGAAAAVVALACSDSSYAPKQASKTDWSGAVIEVAGSNPNAHGELRGEVLDSTVSVDPTKATPIPGAIVVLNLKIQVPPATSHDTATTTVTKIGEVVTDANGRFLVTSIPEGDYYVTAAPPANEPYYSNATWAFASSGSAERDAIIFLPRKLGVPPVDSGPHVPVDPPIGHPIDPPIDSMPSVPPVSPPVDSVPVAPPVSPPSNPPLDSL
jgi:hypothetical protein